MKVIITGATGMVGKGVLLECLDHTDIAEVLSISRRSTGIEHSKLVELIHEDFSDFESIADRLKGYDACYACMGVSATGMSEAQYTKLTYDFTISLAKILHAVNNDMVFVYVSGEGTDSTEKSWIMWARVKGKTENDILNLGFRKTFIFRPGAIIPKKGVQPSSRLSRVLINMLIWLFYLIKLISPRSIVDSIQIGRAMINVTINGYEKEIIRPSDILKLA
ncbi:NAD-dependent epimerase/dehydratase family protein [Reichenbachiella sp.]|uniref:NAD-dependent epimerase/dehydratase family protein n=1 Tax=Reichenbachiella sp. TaxID=2184521 RepID=UPI0032982FA1